MTTKTIPDMLAELPLNDRREYRNFQRYLSLKDRYLARMMTRKRWQKYLGLTPVEAWRYAKENR